MKPIAFDLDLLFDDDLDEPAEAFHEFVVRDRVRGLRRVTVVQVQRSVRDDEGADVISITRVGDQSLQ